MVQGGLFAFFGSPQPFFPEPPPEMLGQSIWNPFTFEEHPYDFKLIMDYVRQLMVQ